MIIRYHVKSAWAHATDGIVAWMTVYLPTLDRHEDWCGALAFEQIVETEESLLEERSKLDQRRKSFELSRSKMSDDEVECEETHIRARTNELSRLKPGGIKEAKVVFDRMVKRPKALSFALTDDHCTALRKALGQFSIGPIPEEPEPAFVTDGGSGSLSIEAHRFKLSLSWRGNSGPTKGGELARVLLQIWREFGGDAVSASAS